MAKLTLTQLAAMKKAAAKGILSEKSYKDQYENEYPGAYVHGGFLQGSDTKVMAAPSAPGPSCMAPMEQPGIWMVENTKRKLIYCNAERGHRGNHRFVMEWTKEHPYQPVPANAGWQTNAWENQGVYPPYPYKPQIAYPSEIHDTHFISEEDYKKYMQPKVEAKDIKVSFKLDKD